MLWRKYEKLDPFFTSHHFIILPNLVCNYLPTSYIHAIQNEIEHLASVELTIAIIDSMLQLREICVVLFFMAILCPY